MSACSPSGRSDVIELMRSVIDLDYGGLAVPTHAVLLTPRFPASRHLIFLLADETGSLRFVAKVPRLASQNDGLEREMKNLALLADSLLAEEARIPTVVGMSESGQRRVLVLTVVAGEPLDPFVVRRNPGAAVALVVDWLDQMPSARGDDSSRFERLLVGPLTRFAERAAADAEKAMVDSTLDILEPLRDARLETVFEHGDLSHPNLLVMSDHRLGVVDWELSEQSGYPVNDLGLFLASASFALERAWTPDRQRAAYQRAFEDGGWAIRAAEGYVARRDIALEHLSRLLLACWARYVANTFERLVDQDNLTAAHFGMAQGSVEILAQVRRTPHYVLWATALEAITRGSVGPHDGR